MSETLHGGSGAESGFQRRSKQYATRSLVVLALLPGVANAVAFVGFATALDAVGLPGILGLYLAIGLVEAPVAWYLMVRTVRREAGDVTLARLFPWRRSIPRWQYVVYGVPAALLSVAVIGVGSQVVDAAIRPALFGWVPSFLVVQLDPAGFGAGGRSVALAIWVLALVFGVVVGSLTQELFFRGFLLPRMAHLGRLAVVLNVGLFAVFHFASPWGWPTFALVALPWAVLVWWKRDTTFALVGHVGMQLVLWVGLTLVLFGVV